MAFDPISWMLGYGATQLVDRVRKAVEVKELRRLLVKSAESWQLTLPEALATQTQALLGFVFAAPLSGEITHADTARRRMTRTLLQERTIPPADLWLDALLEQWSDKRTELGPDAHPFFELSEEVAREYLQGLANALARACRDDATLLLGTVLAKIERIQEQTGSYRGVDEICVIWVRAVLRKSERRRVLRGMFGVSVKVADVFVKPRLVEYRAVVHRGHSTVDDKVSVQSTPSEYDGEAPTRGGGRNFDLGEWIQDASRGHQRLLVRGPVGSGKSELLAHVAGVLARRAEKSSSVPVPIWIDAKDVQGGAVVATIAGRVGVKVEEVERCLQSASRRFICLIDSVDEVSADAVEKIEDFLDLHESVLERVILAIRPSSGVVVGKSREVELAPWGRGDADAFTSRMFGALGILQNPVGAEGERLHDFENPLAVTLAAISGSCTGVENRWSRTELLHSIFAKVFHEWSIKTRRKTPSEGWDRRVLVPLGRVALEYLEAGDPALAERRMRAFFARSLAGDDSGIVEYVVRDCGVMVEEGGRLTFALRGVAEYLAARYVLGQDRGASLDRTLHVSTQAWGGECARHTLAGAELFNDDGAREYFEFVLDKAGELPQTQGLRCACVLIRAASDIDLGHADLRERLLCLIEHFLCDETSVWVSDEMAAAVRDAVAANRHLSVEICRVLMPRLIESREDPAVWWSVHLRSLPPDLSLSKAVHLIQHRDRRVRMVGVMHLEAFMHVPSVRQLLFHEVADVDPWGRRSPARVAAGILRQCPRDTGFQDILAGLKVLAAQSRSGRGEAPLVRRISEAAAYALSEDELRIACPENVSTGSVHSEKGEPVDGQVHGRSVEFVRPPISGFVCWSVLRALAPGLHRAPKQELDLLLSDSRHYHSLSHELGSLAPRTLRTVLPQVMKTFCREAVDELVSLVGRERWVGEILVEEAEKHVRSDERTWFPFRAFESMVADLDPRATSVFCRWLEQTPYDDDELTYLGKRTLANAEVRDLLRRKMSRGCSHFSMNFGYMQMAPSLWESDAEVLSVVCEELDRSPSFETWHHILSAYKYARMSEQVATRFLPFFRSRLRAQDGLARDFVELLDQVDRQRAALHLEDELAALSNSEESGSVRLYAASIWARCCSGARRREVSEYAASNFDLAHACENVRLPTEHLRYLVRLAPDSWGERCRRVLGEWLDGSLLPSHAPLLYEVVEALPLRELADLSDRLTEAAHAWATPWIEVRRGMMSRHTRVGDYLAKICYEAGVACDWRVSGVPLSNG